MKARNTRTKLILMVVAVATFTAIWTIWGADRAEAVIAIIKTTGMFSIARGQATSAHVVNTWGGDERGIVIDWTVLDSAGNILAQSERRRVEPGQASSFNFIPNDGDLAEDRRLAIRVVLRVEGESKNKLGFVATQEVYNTSSGKTTVFLPYIEQ